MKLPDRYMNKNKLLVHMYIVPNTTVFLIVRLLLLRYNYMFRLSMLAIFRLYMKSNNKNKLLVHMYIVTNTTIFLIVRLLLLRYNYMFRPSVLAFFRLYNLKMANIDGRNM